MTSSEAKGSFMEWVDVRDFFRFNGWLSPTTEFACHQVEIDGIEFISTNVILEKLKQHLPNEFEQAWRTMQFEVTTSMFGLNSITI